MSKVTEGLSFKLRCATTCGRCHGSGECDRCPPYFDDANACPACDGTNDCQECGGVGHYVEHEGEVYP